MPTIRIDEDVYQWLKTQAEPFEDTPNTVLRRIAGFDEKSSVINQKSKKNTEGTVVTEKNTSGTTIEFSHIGTRTTGKKLARLWNVNVKHALYHKDGQWYNHLRYFPGALFDPFGYVVFSSDEEYENSPYLQHGVELNAPDGISSIPNYVRVQS